MATKLGDALLYLGADDDKLKRDLDGAERKTKSWGATMTGIAQGFGMGIFGAISGAISGAFDTIGQSINLASDLNETLSKVRTLFGESAGDIEAWALTAAGSMGMTQEAALEAVGTLGNMFMQMGQSTDAAGAMSQSLVQLATDLGSFHNADPSEILDSMSAAFRGEYDSLQKYVPMINAAAVEQRALADTGKAAAAELTALDKQAAIYALTIEGAGAATGDFARTSDGWANTMKTLNAYWTEFKTLLGETLLPILTPLVDKLKDMAAVALPAIANYIRSEVIPAIEAWAANFDSWWADHGQPFLDGIQQMWDDTVTAAAESMGLTSDEFEYNLEGMLALADVLGRQIGTSLGESIGGAFADWVANSWSTYWEGYRQRMQADIDAFKNTLGGLFGFGGGTPAPQMAPSPAPSGGGVSGYSRMPQAVSIAVNVDASNRGVADAARDGTLDALRAAGMS
jgi:hypothetical protein